MELGEGLDDEYVPGQRVIVGAITPCGQCFYCLNGVPGGYLELYVPPARFFEQTDQDVQRNLDESLTEAEKVRCHAVLVRTAGVPAKEILRYLHEHSEIDLVVMATHGRGGVARLMLGSVADKVIRAAPCPVLALRPTTLAAHDGTRAA